MFLSVAETIVGTPVLLRGYCFVKCFLVLQKLLLVGLCGCCSVSLIFCITLFDDYSKCGNY